MIIIIYLKKEWNTHIIHIKLIIFLLYHQTKFFKHMITNDSLFSFVKSSMSNFKILFIFEIGCVIKHDT
jgi:hypothetical protein